MQRLDKFLVNLGCGSRNEIKKFAKDGKILVNGNIVVKTDFKINETEDEIIFCGNRVLHKENIYIMLNKKAGYVTANHDNLNSTIFDLLDDAHKNIPLFAIGRLDKDTEGLLLLTNDGALSHGLMSPKNHVDKTYYVEVIGTVLPLHIDQFLAGVRFKDGTLCKPAKLEIIESGDFSKAYVTISEGKFHQVKIMFKTINCTVSYLKRIKIANLDLDKNLNLGEYRYLTNKEEQYLKNIAFGEQHV